MPSISTILSKVNELEAYESHEERLHHLLEIYIELFPVKEALLFRYSHFGYLAEGVLALQNNEFKNISSIRDDVRSIPGILTSLKKRKAIYYEGADYIKNMGTKYVYTHNSGVVVPITVHSLVIGYLISNEFKKESPIDDYVLKALTFFGKTIGQALCQLQESTEKSIALSRRELQVMQKIANGESTKEIAATLEISEVTVNQYVKNSIKKLEARNRTEAAVKLFRSGGIM